MMNTVADKEAHRLAIQADLDAAKDQAERNRLGQFATPTELALEILEYARHRMDGTPVIRFIDPAIGTGAFFSALLNVFPMDGVSDAAGYEVDPHYGEPAAKLWDDTILDLRLEDFTSAAPPLDGNRFNLLI